MSQKIDMSEVTAVIPIAGMGTRLKPHTHTLPKVLLRVADKPILGHVIDNVKEMGIKKIVFVVGQMREMIYEYIKEHHSSLEVEYVAQNELKGLGHAVYLTHTKVKGPIFIILGDTIIDTDFHNIFLKEGSWIGVKSVKDPQRFGIVEIKDGYISRLIEKPSNPPTDLAIVGVYFLEDSKLLFQCLADNIKENKTTKGEFQLTDGIEAMIKEGVKIRPEEIEGWYDCGKPETLLNTNRFLLDKFHSKEKIIHGSSIHPPVYIAHGAKIVNSVVGPYVSIGEDAELDNVVIQNSIVNKRAKVSNIVLVSSIIGYKAVVNGMKYRVNIGDSSEVDLSRVNDEDDFPH